LQDLWRATTTAAPIVGWISSCAIHQLRHRAGGMETKAVDDAGAYPPHPPMGSEGCAVPTQNDAHGLLMKSRPILCDDVGQILTCLAGVRCRNDDQRRRFMADHRTGRIAPLALG